jgi:YHS domain-containing protein
MWPKLLLLATVAYAGFRVIRLLVQYLDPRLSDENPEELENRSGAKEMVQDPVCGLYIASNDALSAIRSGRRVWFCSEECRLKFLQKEG